MDPFFRKVDHITKNPAWAVFATLLSLIADTIAVLVIFGIRADDVARGRWIIILIVLLSITAIIFALIISAVVRVYLENKSLRRVFARLHNIQHHCRDKVCDLAKTDLTIDALMGEEHLVLNQICTELSHIFWELIRRECHVCTTLVSKLDDGKHETFIWASSQLDHISRAGRPEVIIIENNTRFFEAQKLGRAGKPSHFFSADLEALQKAGKYKDDFENWQQHYLSCIIVPIRIKNGVKGATEVTAQSKSLRPHPAPSREYTPPNETVGFLKVETLFKNRLNDSYHVEIVAAIADLMASFRALRLHWFDKKAGLDS